MPPVNPSFPPAARRAIPDRTRKSSTGASLLLDTPDRHGNGDIVARFNPRTGLGKLPYPPFLVVAYIGLSIYLPNRLFFEAKAMASPLSILAVFTTIALAVWKWNRWDMNKGVAFISGALLLDFTYYPARDRLAWAWPLVAPATILYTGLCLALIIFIWKAREPLAKQTARALGIMAFSLLLLGLANAGRLAFASRENIQPPAGNFEAEFQKALTRDLSSPLNARDFYFIVLDRYPGEETLLTERDFDNRDFYRRLRSQGFTVLEKSRSNYGFTDRSIPSMLNLDYYEAWSRDGYDMENNRLWRFFKSQGFQFVFLPSNFLTTTRNDYADVILNPYPIPLQKGSKNALFQKIMFFERTFLGWVYYTARRLAFGGDMPSQSLDALQSRVQTLEGPHSAKFNEQFGQERQFIAIAKTHVPNTFSHLAQVPGIPGRKFVFSHINHWEHVKSLDSDSLAHVNQSVESLVRFLLENSDPDPVIIIVSDHGGKPSPETVEQNRSLYARYARYPNGPLNQEDILASWYTLNNIGFLYLPDGGEAALYPGMSPVNIWRMLLNYYFRTDFERQEDRFFWKWRHGNITRLD